MFQAADRWATKQCEKQGLVADGQLKRRILGEEIIKSIRFPIMTAKEFADVVLDTNILHPNEIALLFKFFNSSLSSPLMFSETPRQSRAPLLRETEKFIICCSCGGRFHQIATFKVCSDCGDYLDY